jgi:hypothetical protein
MDLPSFPQANYKHGEGMGQVVKNVFKVAKSPKKTNLHSNRPFAVILRIHWQQVAPLTVATKILEQTHTLIALHFAIST